MKQLLAFLASLFGAGKKKKPPVIIVPPPPIEQPKPTKVWPDRRAIGMVMLSNYVGYTGHENYMNGETPFTEWLINHANTCIKNMRELNAQGCIVWDDGGAMFPRPYTYYGDPSLAQTKVDPFFTAINAAGFRTGICIRPDKIQWEFDAAWGLKVPEHYVVASPLEDMVNKVEYARKRWGCTLFYVDSNVAVGLTPATKNTIGSGRLMPSSVFAELHKLYPDCLFIPEWTDPSYDAYVAPYWHKGWAADMRNTLTVIDCGDTNWWQETLNDAVKNGHILMGRIWYASPEFEKIKLAYKP